MAEQLMRQHGITAKGWRFQFDNAKRRFGVCKYKSKVIGLSRHLTELNDVDHVKDTILHEIAHVIAGEHGDRGHGILWKMTAKTIGAKPSRCYSSAEVVAPAKPLEVFCGNCGMTKQVFRRKSKRIACGICCKKYNKGKYDERFLLGIRPTQKHLVQAA
jgi:predicted SprT family Zn-dependent metalloprotease